MPHLTPTPYTVSVYDLMRRPGEMRESDLGVVVPTKLGEGVIAIPEGAKLSVAARLEGLHEGVLVSAHVSGEAVGECSRCLKPISESVEVDFAELFAYSDDEAFDYTVHDDHVDLEPVVRDAVVLSLPFQPVCRPDCPGLDPETGERIEDLDDYQPREVIDPRWSALSELVGDTTRPAGSSSETSDHTTDSKPTD